MWINYPVRIGSLEYLQECRKSILENKISIKAGYPLEFQLSKKGGYSDRIRIKIDETNTKEFWSNKYYKDPSRFPARIKTATYVLFTENLFGEFNISHSDGELRIEKISIKENKLNIFQRFWNFIKGK